MTSPVRVRLDEAKFRALVAGKVVKLTAADGTEVEIILADIGFRVMVGAVAMAVARAERGER